MNVQNIDDIIVIDDVFSFSQISGIYSCALTQKYEIFNSSDLESQNMTNKRLGCRLDIDDQLFDILFTEDVLSVFETYIPRDKYYPWRAYINLGLHSDQHQIHVDDPKLNESKTCLIYMNRNWDCNWGGETIFYDDQRKNIKYTSQYIPGRILIFDGAIPHSAKPQHFNAPPYRFTLAIKFKVSK